MRLPLRPSTLALISLGLAMLAVGIWVEERAAVAAPLVIVGALIVVAGVLFEGWADIEEMSLGQSGLTLKRRPPSVEELTEAGLPPQVAQEMEKWMDALLEVLPNAIDERVNKVLTRRANRGGYLREAAARRMSEEGINYDVEQGPTGKRPPPD